MTTTTLDKDPVHRARMVYAGEVNARSFEEDFYLHWHTPGCIVHKDAENLAFVRPVDARESYSVITDPRIIPKEPTAWWVHILVGRVPFLFNLLPYPLPLVGWERDNKARFYEYNHLKRWIHSAHIFLETSSDLTAG